MRKGVWAVRLCASDMCLSACNVPGIKQRAHHAMAKQVVDLISLKPFDMETIASSVRKTRRVLIVEECMKTGGIGG